jgi:hypothetical protein
VKADETTVVLRDGVTALAKLEKGTLDAFTQRTAYVKTFANRTQADAAAARMGLGWTVVPAPENTLTRALRISFDHGMDELDDLLDTGATGAALKDKGEPGDDKQAWSARLEGLKILRRRFASLLPKAKISVSSGQLNKAGEWDAQRDKPLTAADPGIYMLEWDAPQSLRGLALEDRGMALGALLRTEREPHVLGLAVVPHEELARIQGRERPHAKPHPHVGPTVAIDAAHALGVVRAAEVGERDRGEALELLLVQVAGKAEAVVALLGDQSGERDTRDDREPRQGDGAPSERAAAHRRGLACPTGP